MKRHPFRVLAFTVQEALLAMVILVVLAMFAMPLFKNLSRQSGGITCTSNLRAWGNLVALYSADHQGTFPLAFIPEGANGQISWNHIKAPLVQLYNPATPLREWRRGASINGCPSHSDAPYGTSGYTLRYYSYAINGHLTLGALAGSFRQKANLPRPSGTILLADATDTAGPLCVFTAIKYNNYKFDVSLGKVHDGYLHALFVDNHIEHLKSVSPEQISP